MYHPKKTTPAEIVFVDLGGSVPAAGKLSALTGALADCEALAVVVGGLATEDPARALENFLLDLTLADLSVVEARLERIEKDIQRGKKEAASERPLMERLQAALEQGRRVATVELSPDEERTLRGYQFITRKPTLVLANVQEKDLGNGVAGSVAEAAATAGLPSFELCAPLEQEIARLPEEERQAFLEDFGLAVAARDRFIRAAYDLVDLISFFTVGPDEVRAWSIRRGTLAPRAAGKIHSDMERGFIRAEVVAYDDLIREGSHQACRSKGLVRLEGKTYEVRDGDVIEFRFSV
jgi:GTP-binding protein YchF